MQANGSAVIIYDNGRQHGQARGIYCNCLHPLDRIVPALENWLQNQPGSAP